MSYKRGMEKRVQIGLKLPPSLVARIDEIRSRMDFPPDRTEIIEKAIREWCDRVDGPDRKKRRSAPADETESAHT